MKLLLFWSVVGLLSCHNEPKPTTPAPSLASSGTPDDCLPIVHEWTNKDTPQSQHSLNLCINKSDLEFAVQTFGINESDLVFQYSSADELKRLVKRRNQTIQDRGFELLLDGERVVARVNYKHLIEHANIAHTAEALRSNLPPTASDREIIEFFADYVQSFTLENLSPDLTMADTSSRITGGNRHPLETLSVASGDCDSLSTLFAALAFNQTETSIAFLTLKVDGINHLVPAVGIPPEINDVVSHIEGNPMVVFDMTSRDPNSRTSANVRAKVSNQIANVLWIRNAVEP